MRSLLSALVVTVFAAALAPAAQAQYFGRNKVRYDDFDFKVLETEHFDIYHYEGMETTAGDVARMAERWYDRLSKVLVHQFDERKSIILYADDADFRQTNITNIGGGDAGRDRGRETARRAAHGRHLRRDRPRARPRVGAPVPVRHLAA